MEDMEKDKWLSRKGRQKGNRVRITDTEEDIEMRMENTK
jgi:hypothetical protein